MKKKNIALLLFQMSMLLIAGIMSSCSKGYESPLSGRTFDDMTFGPELSTQLIHFTGQDVSHIVTSVTDSWCQAYFYGDDMRVVVIDNETFSERSTTVTVSDSEDGSKVSFKVTQHQNDAVIPDHTIYNVPAEGGTVNLSLQTNVEIDYVNILADWILPGSRGLSEYTTTVMVTANNEAGYNREGYVELGNKALGLKTSILIRQASHPYIRLDKEYVEIDENGGEIEIQVEANLAFRAEPHENWVQQGEQHELSTYKYSQKLMVSPMTGNETSRRCIVYFVNDDLTVHNMLTIVQKKKQ